MISLQSYEALAQQLLDAGQRANRREEHVPLREGHRRVEESLEWHRCVHRAAFVGADWRLMQRGRVQGPLRRRRSRRARRLSCLRHTCTRAGRHINKHAR